MSGHTPGPWRVIDLEPQGYGDPKFVTNEIECVDGRVVASVIHDSFDEYSMNATLIAAAPDLLEALEKGVIRLEGNLGDDRHMGRGSMTYLLEIFQEAIARAKGEQK